MSSNVVRMRQSQEQGKVAPAGSRHACRDSSGTALHQTRWSAGSSAHRLMLAPGGAVVPLTGSAKLTCGDLGLDHSRCVAGVSLLVCQTVCSSGGQRFSFVQASNVAGRQPAFKCWRGDPSPPLPESVQSGAACLALCAASYKPNRLTIYISVSSECAALLGDDTRCISCLSRRP